MFIKESVSVKVKGRLSRYFRDWAYNLNNCNINTNGENFFLEKALSSMEKENGLTVLDIGSNLGEYISNILKICKNEIEIHSFEPQEKLFLKLKNKYSKNKKIFLNQVAVGEKTDDCIELYKDRENSQLASLYKRAEQICNVNMGIIEIVKSIRLSDYIEENSINHIHIMKIDVEGNELNVLKGMGDYLNNIFVDFIQFEYGGCNLDSKTVLKDFYDLLLSRGFKLARVMPNGLIISDYSTELENFQYCNYIAVSITYLNKVNL